MADVSDIDFPTGANVQLLAVDGKDNDWCFLVRVESSVLLIWRKGSKAVKFSFQASLVVNYADIEMITSDVYFVLSGSPFHINDSQERTLYSRV